MKKAFFIIIAICLTAGAAWAQDPATLKTDQEKISYMLGHNLGRNMTKDDVQIDVNAFIEGLKKGLAGQELGFKPEETQRLLDVFRQQALAKAQKKAMELAAKNAKDGDAFREEFKKKEGVKETESGLLYRVITEGSGNSPKLTDTVTTHYTGKLVDGKEFDSSVKRGQPASFPVNGVVPGWQEALPMMKEGAKWEIVLPPNLAYGAQGAGRVIGPNSTLFFEIELLKINEPEKKEEAKPEATEVKPEEPKKEEEQKTDKKQ
jgi:FKBP-type peptidyl-prolyl cis-trans isomerase FklB